MNTHDPQAVRLGLTPKQASVLAFIERFIREKGYSPSYAEIGEGVGLRSKGGIHRIMKGLKDRGAINSSRLARSSRPLV